MAKKSLKRPRRIQCRVCHRVFSSRSPDPECGDYPTNHKDELTGEICTGVDVEVELVGGTRWNETLDG